MSKITKEELQELLLAAAMYSIHSSGQGNKFKLRSVRSGLQYQLETLAREGKLDGVVLFQAMEVYRKFTHNPFCSALPNNGSGSRMTKFERPNSGNLRMYGDISQEGMLLADMLGKHIKITNLLETGAPSRGADLPNDNHDGINLRFKAGLDRASSHFYMDQNEDYVRGDGGCLYHAVAAAFSHAIAPGKNPLPTRDKPAGGKTVSGSFFAPLGGGGFQFLEALGTVNEISGLNHDFFAKAKKLADSHQVEDTTPSFSQFPSSRSNQSESLEQKQSESERIQTYLEEYRELSDATINQKYAALNHGHVKSTSALSLHRQALSLVKMERGLNDERLLTSRLKRSEDVFTCDAEKRAGHCFLLLGKGTFVDAVDSNTLSQEDQDTSEVSTSTSPVEQSTRCEWAVEIDSKPHKISVDFNQQNRPVSIHVPASLANKEGDYTEEEEKLIKKMVQQMATLHGNKISVSGEMSSSFEKVVTDYCKENRITLNGEAPEESASTDKLLGSPSRRPSVFSADERLNSSPVSAQPQGERHRRRNSFSL